jgi:hypothetical protein
LIDKVKLDKINTELENKITRESKGFSDSESKEKQVDAELEQIKKLQQGNSFLKEQATNYLERLKEEEGKAKDMLDEKMNLQQALNEVLEQISEVKIFNQKTRQEIINHQIEFS